MREEGLKWEPCLRNGQRFRAASLHQPCFDIYYHRRASGVATTAPQPIPYAFLVSIKAPNVPDLYNRVVRTYANVLVQIRPRLRIELRT